MEELPIKTAKAYHITVVDNTWRFPLGKSISNNPQYSLADYGVADTPNASLRARLHIIIKQPLSIASGKGGVQGKDGIDARLAFDPFREEEGRVVWCQKYFHPGFVSSILRLVPKKL